MFFYFLYIVFTKYHKEEVICVLNGISSCTIAVAVERGKVFSVDEKRGGLDPRYQVVIIIIIIVITELIVIYHFSLFHYFIIYYFLFFILFFLRLYCFLFWFPYVFTISVKLYFIFS